MSIKLADTLEPMTDFPAAYAKDIQFSDNETLQTKFDNGDLGGGSSSESTAPKDVIQQLAELPTPSDDILGTVVQYIGSTTTGYTHNFFYECVAESNSTNKWKSINVMAIPTKVSEFTNDTGFITVNTDQLENYYKKSDVNDLIGKINKLTSQIVESLPDKDISATTIYLIKVADQDMYTQYMYIDNIWAALGTTSVSLDGYVTASQLSDAIKDFAKSTDLIAHTSNSDIHVTEDEKANIGKIAKSIHSHSNLSVLNKLTDSKINNWDSAVTSKHSHSNKSIIDRIISNGGGTGFLANDANYKSAAYVGKSAPSTAQIWVDNTDPNNLILKVYNGTAWIDVCKLEFDAEMLDDSDNLVKNKTIKKYIDEKIKYAGGSSTIAEREW